MFKSVVKFSKTSANEFRSNISEILSMYIPIFFEQFAFQLCSTLISTVISRMGSTQVAGYNLAQSITIVINQFITSLATGTAVLVAQYRGKGDTKATGRVAVQALYLMTLVGVIINAILFIGHDTILNLVIGGTEAAVFNDAKTFFVVASFSYPFLSLYTGTCNIIRGSGFPKKTLAISIITNVLYALFSFIFIVFFNMGMYGPGFALILARIYGTVYGVYMVKKGNANLEVETLRIKKLSWSTVKLVLFMGVPIAIENVMFQFGKLITQTFIIPLGTAAITANALANNMTNLMIVPGSALQTTTIPIIGKYIGMDKPKKAKSIIISCTVFSSMVAAVVCIFVALIRDNFIGMYNQGEEVNMLIREVLKYYLWMMPLLWSMSFVVPAALRAAGDVRNNMVTAISSMFIFRVAVSFVLTKYTSLGLMGIWFGMYLDWIFRSTLFVIRLCGKKWLTKKVV